jgi:hypothetical protein
MWRHDLKTFKECVWIEISVKDNFNLKKLNSVALVRKLTIPTERPPLVGEVSANPLRVEGVTWSAQRIPTAVHLGFLDRSRYFFIQIAP